MNTQEMDKLNSLLNYHRARLYDLQEEVRYNGAYSTVGSIYEKIQDHKICILDLETKLIEVSEEHQKLTEAEKKAQKRIYELRRDIEYFEAQYRLRKYDKKSTDIKYSFHLIVNERQLLEYIIKSLHVELADLEIKQGFAYLMTRQW